MKTTVESDDIRWEMKWGQVNADGTRMYPDQPESEMIFEPAGALAMLLINDVVFLNNHWWHEDWPAEAKKVTSLNVNCNDIFAWGMADAEEVTFDELEDLYSHYEKDQVWGPSIWCIKKRNMMPQKPVYRDIQSAGTWDLDSMGLKANDYDRI